MKGKGYQRSEDRVSANEQARVEIQSFLRALDSYAECFARNPGVSFEEYSSRLIMVARNEQAPAKLQPRAREN
jgi:hypothetical protein